LSGTFNRVASNGSQRRSLSYWVALLAIVLLAVSASAFYAFSAPDEYTGTALVQFRPRATENGGVVGSETAASAAAGYAAYLGSPSTVQAVAAPLGVSASDMRANMELRLLPGTTSLQVSLSSESPELAAQGANALAQVAVTRAVDDPTVSGTVLANAAVPNVPSGPARALILVAGVMLGLILAGAVHLLVSARRRTRGAASVDQSAQPVAAALPAGPGPVPQESPGPDSDAAPSLSTTRA
jgi:uncharacterized protein involved in exopolysaccharide biosynthesis